MAAKSVEYFENHNIKSATIQKKVGWLIAAVNLAIEEGRLKFNPFSGVVPKRDDKEKRLPLDEADIKNAKRNLDRLDGDRLLFRLLACTGMRLSEAFEIDSEIEGARLPLCDRRQKDRRNPSPRAVAGGLSGIFRSPLRGRCFEAMPRRLETLE